jgi:hypothetical protein
MYAKCPDALVMEALACRRAASTAVRDAASNRGNRLPGAGATLAIGMQENTRGPACLRC